MFMHQMELPPESFVQLRDCSRTISLCLEADRVQVGDYIEMSCIGKMAQHIQVYVTGCDPAPLPDGTRCLELHPTDLQKFLDAQENGYEFGDPYTTALSEIRQGHKQSHWIWYVFPWIRQPGWTGITALFFLRDLDEAKDYYAHPILGARLVQIVTVLLGNPCEDLLEIFGDPDAFKVWSCLTLFCHVAPHQPVFRQALDRFCMGREEPRTVRLLGL